jgi:DNA-binding transcriptional MocR family regulator
MDCMDWIPTLSEWSGPAFLRIVDALAADVVSGRLKRGQQLPTHRALASALELDLTTVTRAYREARRRGLIDAQVGRGTFVSETTARTHENIPHAVKIDLSMNIPPQPIEANLELHIARGLQSIRDETGLSAFLNYQQPGGSDDEREVATQWLRRRVPDAQSERLIVYPGNQAILFNALLSLTSPGDVVLTEALTFPGMKAAARKLGLRLVGVEMDEEGVRPDALKSACKKYKAKAVYLTPTLHNPTTATLPPKRREMIADIIRANKTILIEDDAYGWLQPGTPPIANLIPERTYLAVGLSKCIAPALRISYLLAPDADAELEMRNNLVATMLMPPPLMAALVTHWIRSGIADSIIQAIRDESAARQRLAGKFLKGVPHSAGTHGHHLWLPLPRRWNRTEFLHDLSNRGLAVVGDDAFAVDAASQPAVRVCLGAPRTRDELAQGLRSLAEAVSSPVQSARIV